jgi:hypothetical protein
MRAIFILVCFICGIIGAYFGAEHVVANQDLINLLLTAFTVFAGFLVAVIAIVADPSTIPPGSWRIAENRRAEIDASLIRHMYLFYVYLVAIALLALATVLMKLNLPNGVDAAKLWLARAYLTVGITGFLLTFGLPIMIVHMQRARIDREIERRRETEGITRQAAE